MEGKKDIPPGRRKLIRNFLETTTVKGVCKTVKTNSRILKLMWILVVIFGVSVAVYLLIELFQLYISHSTVTSIEAFDEDAGEWHIPFPDITICNMNSLATHAADFQAFKKYMHKLYEFVNVSKSFVEEVKENYPDVDKHMEYLYDTYGFLQNHDLNKNLTNERIRTTIVYCKTVGDGVANCRNEHNILLSMFDTSVGPCFTINMTSLAEEIYWIYGVTAIFHLNELSSQWERYKYTPTPKETQASGLILAVHSPNSAPHLNDHINLSPGTHTSIHLEPIKKKRLPSPYSDCYLDQEQMLRNKIYGSYLNKYHKYDVYECRAICMQFNLISHCGCILGDIYHTEAMREKFHYCGSIDKYKDVYDMVDSLKCTSNWANFAEQNCECYHQCDVTDYYIKSSSTPWPHTSYEMAFFRGFVQESAILGNISEYQNISKLDDKSRKLIQDNFLQVHILFDRDRLLKFIDKPAVGFTMLIGTLGGILNLWIGISFVTIFEVVELGYHLIKNK